MSFSAPRAGSAAAAPIPSSNPLLGLVPRVLVAGAVTLLLLASTLAGPPPAVAEGDQDAEVTQLRAAMDTLPFVAYGTDGRPDGTVIVMLRGKVCGSVDVNGRGEWVVWVPVDAPCNPRAGATLTFAMDGEKNRPTEKWAPGGLPSDLRRGILFNRS